MKIKVLILFLSLILVFGLLIAGCGGGGSTPTPTPTFTLTSSVFLTGAAIPLANAYNLVGGDNKSLPLAWTHAPFGTQYFAIIMVDSDSPAYKHWRVINIPSSTSSLAEGASVTTNDSMPAGSTELNSEYTTGYEGPWPTGTHTYTITIYALSSDLTLSADATNAAFIAAADAVKLGFTSMTGTYSFTGTYTY